MQIVTVRLTGHLRRDDLALALAHAVKEAREEKCGIVVDCLEMQDYDLDARHAFVDWNRRHRDRFKGVAILTDRLAWHLVISAMALASGQRMKPFQGMDSARAWLNGL